MEKRGISHIDVVLSFVIFIVAVGFALFFFNPGDNTRLIDTTLDYSFREISQNTSTEIETYSVILDNSLMIADSAGTIAINFSGTTGMTRVESYDGLVLESTNDGSFVYVNSPSGWANIDFIFVEFGDEFNESSVFGPHDTNYYEIGSSNVRKVISESELLDLNSSYYNDYRGLKSQKNFNLPGRINFGFSLIFDDGSLIIAERVIPAGLEVFSRTERVEVLRVNGETQYADLMVKLW